MALEVYMVYEDLPEKYIEVLTEVAPLSTAES